MGVFLEPTRFESGVADRLPSHPMGGAPFLDPTRFVRVWDVFTGLTLAASGVTGWHLDAVDPSGADNTAAAIADAHGGVLTLAPGAAAGDNLHYQWGNNTDVLELFKLAAGKRAWLRTRFKVEVAGGSLPLIGWHVVQDDPWNTAPTDHFLIRTLAGDPDALVVAIAKASTPVTIALGNLVSDTWVTVTAYYDGRDTVKAWAENDAGEVTASGSVSVSSAAAGDLLPDTEMTVAFGSEAVSTGADVFSLDYVLAVTDR